MTKIDRKRKLISADEAVEAKRQHTTPCGDCPWAKDALPGWLGTMTAGEWIDAAHGEARVECHTLLGAQCAGIATYRANVAKRCRNANILRLPADREDVFSNPQDFLDHHE